MYTFSILPFVQMSCTRSSLLLRNHLLNISSPLSNEFCILRHGQSMANVQHLISSHPDVAPFKHGLSPIGRQQAEAAGQAVLQYYKNGNYDGLTILSSDYLRANETATIVGVATGVPVTVETALRERWFGEWDGGSDVHYPDVWNDDALDPYHTNRGVESVMAVMDRTTTCVLQWNQRLTNHLILLVAHGDVLQITQTAFSKMDGSQHRTLDHLDTATLRPLRLVMDQL